MVGVLVEDLCPVLHRPDHLSEYRQFHRVQRQPGHVKARRFIVRVAEPVRVCVMSAIQAIILRELVHFLYEDIDIDQTSQNPPYLNYPARQESQPAFHTPGPFSILRHSHPAHPLAQCTQHWCPP